MRGRKVRKEKAVARGMESGEFAELILKGLIDEGYSGYELLDGHFFHADSVRQYGTAEVLSQRI